MGTDTNNPQGLWKAIESKVFEFRARYGHSPYKLYLQPYQAQLLINWYPKEHRYSTDGSREYFNGYELYRVMSPYHPITVTA